MKLKYTILYVEDVPKTLKFYENAFGCKTRFLHEAGDYGELDTGATSLSFSSIKLMTDLGKNPKIADPKAPVFEIAFETDNVKKWLDQSIQFGATLVQSLKDEPWRQTTSYVSDPNGFLIEICTPLSSNNVLFWFITDLFQQNTLAPQIQVFNIIDKRP